MKECQFFFFLHKLDNFGKRRHAKLSFVRDIRNVYVVGWLDNRHLKYLYALFLFFIVELA